VEWHPIIKSTDFFSTELFAKTVLMCHITSTKRTISHSIAKKDHAYQLELFDAKMKNTQREASSSKVKQPEIF
jgi:hypothetical protein